MATKGAIVIG